MSVADIINTLGVSLILLAFFLLTLKKISPLSAAYNLLNLFGAGLACYGAFLINAMPFVILEVIWCGVAIYGLLKRKSP
jgi:hypothetical protein